MIPSPFRRPLGMMHPRLQPLARGVRTVERLVQWTLSEARFASTSSTTSLQHRVKKHQSVLRRKLGATDMQLQEQKVQNLRCVIRALDGRLLRPGETLSFCRAVGPPLRIRGFVDGMQLSRGEAVVGVGGGMCQASNLLYWLTLHSELTIVERHHHSFDPFPDDGRVLPYASGATVLWPHRDLQVRNNTDDTFQIRMWLDDKCLNGDLRCDRRPRRSFSVFERGHAFFVDDGVTYRRNELWRRVRVRDTGKHLAEEFIVANCGEVKYDVHV